MVALVMPISPGFKSARFGLEVNDRLFTSPFDKSVQAVELTGSRWGASYNLPKMRKEEAANWRSFFTSLKGRVGTFIAFDPPSRNPLGSNLGTPLIAGVDQTGESITTDGWDFNETGLLLPGDYFEIGGELKIVKYGTSVDSDGFGAATIEFVPSIRVSPADASSIITVNAKTTMRLISSDQAFWEESPLFWGFSFAAIEIFT